MSEWKKVKIGDIFAIEKGSLQSSKNTPGKYDFITAASEWKNHNSYDHDCEAIVYAVAASGSLGRAHYVNGKFIASDLCFILTEKNKDKYPVNFLFYQIIFEMLRAEIVSKTKTGTSKESINRGNFSNYEIPYFLIDFQLANYQRFVDAKNTIKTLIDEYEKQKSYAKQLRQNILQEAIEGKLTADWRKQHPVQKGNPDYDAKALFEQIQNEKYHTDLFAPNGAHAKKAKSVSSEPIRVTRKEKSLPPITEDEIPFEIPAGWKWVRLGDVGEIYRGSGIKKSDMVESGLPCVRYGELYTTYGLTFSDAKSFIKKNLFDKSKKFGSKSVIFTLTGENRQDIAKAAAYLGDNFVAASGDLAFWVNHSQEPCYLSFYMASLYFTNIKKKIATGDFIIHMSVEKIKKVPLPLPPLAEQKEIVARVEQHLQTITQLETQIATRETITKQLMQSILKDAFEEA